MTIELVEIGHQDYTNSKLSSGRVVGHEPDTVYLRFERDGEEATTIYLRDDEALSVLWLLSGTLWSARVGLIAEVEELRAQLCARERDFVTQQHILARLARLTEENTKLQAAIRAAEESK